MHKIQSSSWRTQDGEGLIIARKLSDPHKESKLRLAWVFFILLCEVSKFHYLNQLLETGRSILLPEFFSDV